MIGTILAEGQDIKKTKQNKFPRGQKCGTGGGEKLEQLSLYSSGTR